MSGNSHLKANFKKLKSKIIDTGKLLELYKSTKQSLDESTNREYELLKFVDQKNYDISHIRPASNIDISSAHVGGNDSKEVEHLKLKLSGALKTIAPLNMTNKRLTEEVDRLKKLLEQKDTSLESKNTFIEQLQADIISKRQQISDLGNVEEYKKEIKRLKKELDEKDRKIKDLKSKLQIANQKYSEVNKQPKQPVNELEQISKQPAKEFEHVSILETPIFEEIHTPIDKVNEKPPPKEKPYVIETTSPKKPRKRKSPDYMFIDVLDRDRKSVV